MSDIHDFEPLWGVWAAKQLLGRGSFGSVWRAERIDEAGFESAIKHIPIPQDNAEIKELYDEGIISNEKSAYQYYDMLRESLVKEIRFMYAFREDKNIVTYEDHLVIPRKNAPGYDVFIRMELLSELSAKIRNGTFTPEQVCALGLDICLALCALKREHVIHRDIKPANILVNSKGVYKLSDFGVARQMEKTSLIMSKKGTYAYMAPEVYKGEAAGETADIYSLGLVMHRLLNGNRAPFLPLTGMIGADDAEAAIAKRMGGEELLHPAYAPPELGMAICRACAFHPADRFQSPEEFMLTLQNCMQSISADTATAQKQHPIETSCERLPSLIKSQSAHEPSASKNKAEIAPAASSEDQEQPGEEPFRKKAKPALWIIAAAIILAVIFAVNETVSYSMAISAAKNMDFEAAANSMAFVIAPEIINKEEYEYISAGKLMLEGDYDGAIESFKALGDSERVQNCINETKYQQAYNCYNAHQYSSAIELYNQLGSYKDSIELGNKTKYDYCVYLMQIRKNYSEAASQLLGIVSQDYADSKELQKQNYFLWANQLFENKEYSDAYKKISCAGDYEGAESLKQLITSNVYYSGINAYHNGRFSDAFADFMTIGESYGQSKIYIALIEIRNRKMSSSSIKYYYNLLIDNLDFEDTKTVMLDNWSIAKYFLEGKWKSGSTYLKFIKNSDNNFTCSYNLPFYDFGDYFDIEDGVYLLCKTDSDETKKMLKLTILNEDTLQVFAYKNGKTYTLYRE